MRNHTHLTTESFVSFNMILCVIADFTKVEFSDCRRDVLCLFLKQTLEEELCCVVLILFRSKPAPQPQKSRKTGHPGSFRAGRCKSPHRCHKTSVWGLTISSSLHNQRWALQTFIAQKIYHKLNMRKSFVHANITFICCHHMTHIWTESHQHHINTPTVMKSEDEMKTL